MNSNNEIFAFLDDAKTPSSHVSIRTPPSDIRKYENKIKQEMESWSKYYTELDKWKKTYTPEGSPWTNDLVNEGIILNGEDLVPYWTKIIGKSVIR